MTPLRSRRLAALLSVPALGAGAVTVPAQAGLLGGLLPSAGTIITGAGDTLGGLLPGAGGVVTSVTGSVGGAVAGVQGTVTGLVDETLGSIVGGASGGLPADVLDSLLGTLLANSSGVPGASGNGAPIVLSGGSVTAGGVVLDASAPRPTVRVLSRLKAIGRNGRMRMQIRTDEPGIVAVAVNVRPGAAVKGRAAMHSRKLVKVPSIVLGYRRAGKLVVTVKLSRAAQRALGSSRNARASVGTVAADVFRNQDSGRVKLRLKR